MPLVERVMGLEEPQLPVHAFFAANHQRIDAALTRQQVIDMFAMDAATVTEYDTLAAMAPTGTTALATAQKAMFLERIHSIFLLAESRYTGYDTPAAVRTKLGL